MLKAGSLNHLVIIQRMGATTDALGQPIKTWAEVARVWADIRHPSGLATIRGDMQTSVVKASIRVRYRTDVAAGMRVLHGAVVYSIKAVLPDEARREHVDLVCEVT